MVGGKQKFKKEVKALPDLSLNWPLAGAELGLGGLVGFAIGYFFKKSLKVAFLAAGCISLVLVLLSQLDLVSIQWGAIERTYSSAVEGAGGSRQILESIIQWLTDRVPLGGGLTIGFLVGMKVG